MSQGKHTASKKATLTVGVMQENSYLPPAADENFVTDFVPSEIACLANSPGRMSRTDVWISRDEIVDFFEYEASSGDKE